MNRYRQCWGTGAASFEAVPEPEPIFWSVGAKSWSRLYKTAPNGSLRKAKKNVLLFYYVNMKLVQFVKTIWSKKDFYYN